MVLYVIGKKYNVFKKSKNKIILILGLLYFISRLINLDSDIPIGWNVINYQHFDEFFYSIGANNLYFYNVYNPQLFGLSFEMFWGSIPYWDFIIFIFFKLFGVGITSVRISSVITGLIAYLLYINIIQNLFKDYVSEKKIRTLALLLIIYPLIDPIYYFSNVIHEPSIYRVLFVTIILSLTLSYEVYNQKLLSFYLGIFSAFAFFFVYPQNLFLVFYSLFFIIIFCKSRKCLAIFLFGCFLIFNLWFIFYKLTYENSLQKSLETLNNYGNERNLPFSLSRLKEISKLFFTNFIILSPLFSSFFYVTMFLFFSKIKQITSNKKILTLCLFFVTFFAQSIISIDYVERKGIILYFPVLIFVFLILLEFFKNNFSFSKASLILFLFFSSFIYFFITWWTSNSSVGVSFFHLNFINKYAYLLCFFSVFLFVYFIYIFNKPKLLIHLFICLNIYNLFFLYKFRMTKINTFSQIQKRVSKLSPGYVVSGFSYAFPSSNNELKPFLYYYYPKIHGYRITKNDLNDLETLTFNKFLSSSRVPVYTIVQDTIPVMKNYPASKIIFHESNYNDVETYYSLYDTSYITKFKSQRNIFLIQLNAKK